MYGITPGRNIVSRHNRPVFDEIWKIPIPGENFIGVVKDYLELILDSHMFIFHTIPSIMQQPVLRYWKEGDKLFFELDFTHDVEDPLQHRTSVDGGGRGDDDRDGDGMDCDSPGAHHQVGDGMDCDGQSGQQDAPRSSRRYKPVIFQLDHATGYITSSDVGRGVLYRMYGSGSVREFFQQQRGVQGVADLALSEDIGSKMRYDTTTGQWRIYDAEIGI